MELSPLAAFKVGWENRRLIWRMARREVEARYRGAWFGLLWSALVPLLTALVYSFVFGHIFQSRWQSVGPASPDFTLVLFSGVVIYGLFAECVNRAPSLMLENVSYIKKVVFPLEIIPWVALSSALFNLLIGLLVLIALYFVRIGPPPLTALLWPIVVAPLALVTLGVTWTLSALGVYLRDVKQMVGIFTSMLMFLSPIFYPVSAINGPFRKIIQANPLTPILENSRDVLFWGRLPDMWALASSFGLAWLVAWLGYACFASVRKGFADVV